jgi:3-methyladenine DNA glycosylase/8-oxoguanine DNA glycosylase
LGCAKSSQQDRSAKSVIFNTKRHPKTEALMDRAILELSRSDPTMAELIRRVGPCQLAMRRRNHYFASLVEAIIYQQLGMKAAAAILARFRGIYSFKRFPKAGEIITTPAAQLRAAGLSPQKISYLRDLSRCVLDESVPLRRLSSLDDEQVIEHLTQVKGIGRWTAEMFLIFSLGRPDVLPLDDLGIRKAAQRAYGFKTLPAARTLERIGRRWQPYRSIAAWYLWASVDAKAPEPPPAKPPR